MISDLVLLRQVFRAILKSEQLKEAIADLADMPGASTVGVRVSPDAPHFHLSVDGNYGRLDIRFPDKSEVRGNTVVHCQERRGVEGRVWLNLGL